MTELNLENLDLKFEDGIAFMKVSGPVTKDVMDEGLGWFAELTEAQDGYNLCVDMAQSDFDGLGEIREEFKRVGDVLRAVQTMAKCALLSDSMFLRNSAKVEGAVIPGLEIEAYAIEDIASAMSWLKDENTAADITKNVQEERPSVTDIVSEAEPVPMVNEKDAPESDNPWDNLKLAKVDY